MGNRRPVHHYAGIPIYAPHCLALLDNGHCAPMSEDQLARWRRTRQEWRGEIVTPRRVVAVYRLKPGVAMFAHRVR